MSLKIVWKKCKKYTSVRNKGLQIRFTGSWGTQILNDIKEIAKSTTCGKCHLGKCHLEEVLVGGSASWGTGLKNLTLERTIFFQFCRWWKFNSFFRIKIVPGKSDRLRSRNWQFPQLVLPQLALASGKNPPTTGTPSNT